MNQPAAWHEDAFFDSKSADAETTNHGPLWHDAPGRWGHAMHTMCSYHGMFPAKLVHYFVQKYSQPGDLVVDPFSGRGTTTLQAAAEGRKAIGNDLNPLAYVLTRAKARPPEWSQATAFVQELEREYRPAPEEESEVPPDIRMLFHPNTLRQLNYLRERLLSRPLSRWNAHEFMLAGAVAGILHGGHRVDGSSAYLSISMPNTFSMSPQYVKKYIKENGLVPPDQNVFECVRDKLARLYLDSCEGFKGTAYRSNASKFLRSRALRPSSVNLLLTSPPYLRVVNYGTSNWIRLWWLGVDGVGRQRGAGRRALDRTLDHGHTYKTYCEFMLRIFRSVRSALRRDGVAAFVIGDVATPSGSSIALAERLWRDTGSDSGLKMIDLIEDTLPTQNKVSRIWGETKGRATERDCVLVLARNDGEPSTYAVDIGWEEPYKDAGPDGAHDWLRQRRGAT